MTDQTAEQTAEKVFTATFEILAQDGWRRLSLSHVAEIAGVEMVDVYRLGATKIALLDSFARHIDQQVIDAGIEDDAEETARERLFEIMMRRYDLLKDYRPGLKRLMKDLKTSPLDALVQGPTLLRAMECALVAAGISADGWRGRVRAKSLASTHLGLLKTFFNDESEDLGKTMAALDKRLERIEGLAIRYKL